MKKLILTSALALAIGAGASAPAHAGDSHGEWIEVQSFSWSSNPFVAMIYLLVPRVQSAN